MTPEEKFRDQMDANWRKFEASHKTIRQKAQARSQRISSVVTVIICILLLGYLIYA